MAESCGFVPVNSESPDFTAIPRDTPRARYPNKPSPIRCERAGKTFAIREEEGARWSVIV